MRKLVECVPNFSEGRDKKKIELIVAAARSVAGARVLDVETDADHHRMVLTFVASPRDAIEAAFRAAKKASELIDLNVHKGEHPRMGATDVIPFIPVNEVDLAECVGLAKTLGERIATELGIPVYLYGHAAVKPERRDLANVRKGQFEGLKAAIFADPSRAPDFGPLHLHPTAGATAVGAREQIINFNVNLDLKDIEAGKALAKKIRTSGGGLPELRAKEIALGSGNIQISTVLTNYKITSIATVVKAVETEAKAHRAGVLSTEIVGLVPRESLLNFTAETLKLQNFDPRKQVLEDKLEELASEEKSSSLSPVGAEGRVGGCVWQTAAAEVVQALASVEPTPGGGSGAAIAGAMGCGLAQMALGISLQSKKLDAAAKPALEAGHRKFWSAKGRFLELCGEDAAAFEAFMAAAKLPKECADRSVAMQAALAKAAEVPLKTAKLAAESYAETVHLLASTSPGVASDMKCAGHLLKAAALCAAENVRINTASFKDRSAAENMDKNLDGILNGIKA